MHITTQIRDDAGVERVPLPPRLTGLKADAECGIQSVKAGVLSQMILFGERSLRRALSEYMAHHHTERPHIRAKVMSSCFHPLKRSLTWTRRSRVESGSVGYSTTTTVRPHEYFDQTGAIRLSTVTVRDRLHRTGVVLPFEP